MLKAKLWNLIETLCLYFFGCGLLAFDLRDYERDVFTANQNEPDNKSPCPFCDHILNEAKHPLLKTAHRRWYEGGGGEKADLFYCSFRKEIHRK